MPKDSVQGDGTPLVDGGFAILRTPLLPFGDFLSWSRLTRDALAEDSLNGRCGNEVALDILRDIVTEPAFREAVRIASSALADEVDAWLTGRRKIDAERLLYALTRYFGRATYRCTPFGLFAGCSTVRVAETTELVLNARSAYTRVSRIDMHHLAELSRVLSADPDCRRCVPLRTNTSVAMLGGRLHYVETHYAGRMRTYALTAADPTPEILDALARGRHGTTFGKLAEPLLAEGYSAEEVEDFVTELLDSQLLVPDLEPIVSGGDAAAALAATLEAVGCASRVSDALRDVCARLRAIDAAGAGRAPDYDAAVAPLRQLQAEVDEAKILQVDLYKPAPEASIGRVVINDAIEAVKLLAQITPSYDPLAAFVARFETRYETREIPLLEALDEEVGIGMPSATADDGLMRRVAEARDRNNSILADLRCRAAFGHIAEVQLTDEDIERLRWPGQRSIPDALAFFGSIVAASSEAVDRGQYQLLVSHTAGPSGARLLGRFAHLDEALERRIRAHLAAEEALQPDVVFAEIVHLPQGRIGNVIARPTLRAHELSYLGRGSAPPEQQIDAADLWLSVRRGRIKLRSARLDREVQPRLSTAHNYRGEQELPVYRFLCTLQDHARQGYAHWSWGSQINAPFLPRVTRGRLILSAATWNLSVGDIKQLTEAGRKSDYQAIDEWRLQRELPRFALLVDGDNSLPIDFENPISAFGFAKLLKGRQAATVIEAVLEPGALCTAGPEGRFTNEIVIPLVRSAPAEPAAETDRPHVKALGRAPARNVVRVHPPGSEWLYAKLYCGRGSADRILRNLVAPVLLRIRAELPLRRWFFVRYADPDFHIRLRFMVGAEGAPRLIELLGAATVPAIASGSVTRLVYDTYLPEVERYGGPDAIGIAEAIFSHDSDAAIALVAAPSDARVLREAHPDLAVLAGVDRLLADAAMPLDDRIAFLERTLGQVSAAVRQVRSLEFRRRRAEVMEVLTADAGEDLLGVMRSVLAARSTGIRPLLTRMRELDDAGALQAPFEDVLLSFSHMWVNRTLANGAAVEPVLYDRLQRAYRGFAGRARAAAVATATQPTLEPVPRA